MNQKIDLRTLLGSSDKTSEQRLALFAWLSLGIIESLTKGIVTPIDAVRIYFHADNCLFVRYEFGQEIADEIMSHGTQLADIFEVLSTDEAEQEFQTELAMIQSLSLNILERERVAA